MEDMEALLGKSAVLHQHLCPRQVLGVRMGLLAGDLFCIPLPQARKRLLAVVETDGCFADGITVVTGCRVGKRTLRVEDLGKVAVTFVDTLSGRAVRMAPQQDIRERAREFAPEARNRWGSQLLGYQRMPVAELLTWRSVSLSTPVEVIVGRPGVRTNCALCGEEIINQREVVVEGRVYCRCCAGFSYYEHSTTPFEWGVTINEKNM
jgi:formylmethanofuran dehydrogenase subunit E